MREVCVVSSVIQSSVVCAWFAQQVPQVCSAVLKAPAFLLFGWVDRGSGRHGGCFTASVSTRKRDVRFRDTISTYRRRWRRRYETTMCFEFWFVFYSFHTHWLTFCDRYSWDWESTALSIFVYGLTDLRTYGHRKWTLADSFALNIAVPSGLSRWGVRAHK